MKKKVCHVISGFFRDNARNFQRQCKSLYNAGYDVCVLTNDGKPDEVLDGISIYSCKKFWQNRIKVFFFAKWQFFDKAVEIDADIYQLHSPELIYLGLQLKKMGKVVVYDAHEDLPKHILEKEWIPLIFRGVISSVVEFFMNKSLAKYDAIISPHLHVVEEFKKINSNVEEITNFPLISTSFEFTLTDYLKREKIMCYTGTVYEYSNQEIILEAMDSIPEITYEIAGYISETHLEALRKKAAFSRVKIIGRIPWQEMEDFYKRTIFGLVIYDYKLNLGFRKGSYATNKMFEYMEAGIPFICTDYEMWKELVEKENCGICIEPGNLTQLKNAMVHLLNNPEKAYEMGQNGRKAVLEKYNWNNEEKKYLELFNKLKNNYSSRKLNNELIWNKNE